MKLEKWLKKNRNIKSLIIATPDLNGIWRGKRTPSSQISKIEKGNFRMPISIQNLDIWGKDIEESKWVFKTGDADGKCFWTGRMPLNISWLNKPSALIPVSLFLENNSPFSGDPRFLLNNIKNKFKEKKLNCVLGIEIEFYLIKSKKDLKYSDKDNLYSISEMEDLDHYFNEIQLACELQDIVIESTISECGPGQFEIVLKHQNDIVKVADDIMFLKYIIKGLAEKNGFRASFMPKPFGEKAGSGMHAHCSIIDNNDNNIFDNGKSDGSKLLKNAIAGLLNTMAETTLVMAPNLNSYRRFTSESHAPNLISWGYENRTVAIRIPGGENNSRRIEHRVAGSDVNPYLYIFSIVSGILFGIDNKLNPIKPVNGNAYATDNEFLPASWQAAINSFQNGSFVKEMFPKELIQMFLDCKNQECKTLSTKVTDDELYAYLNSV